MGSPEGDRLRRLARKQQDVADEVRRAAKQFGVLAERPSRTIRGMKFEGPFAVEVRGATAKSTDWLETVKQQLQLAVTQLEEEAEEAQQRAVAADLRHLAKLALDKLTGNDG